MAKSPPVTRHVPHLYLPSPWSGVEIPLDDGHVNHLRKVLKLDEGSDLSYTDGAGTLGSGTFSDGAVRRGPEATVARPNVVTAVVAPPSSRDRLRFLVEKTAELGVSRLLWIRTARTTGRPPREAKAMAWATAALEQSRGAWMMEIGTTTMGDLDPADLVVADPDGLRQAPADRSTLLIGPEGGLASEEIPSGAVRLSLGPTVLRVETAAVVGVLALISQPAPSPAH